MDDEATWYFRESTSLNSHHLHWHDVLPHKLERFGELFYYMHSQILARHEAERLSNGLKRTKPFCYEEWDHPIEEGYDPKLGELWTPRPGGMVMGTEHEREKLKKHYGDIKDVVKQGGEYKNGKDEGIEGLGRLVQKTLHNAGHGYLNKMGGNGVMGTAVASLRDPIFYSWHSCLEEIFREYKNSLGQYMDHELSFDGVEIVNMKLKSNGVSLKNTIVTFMETREIHLRNIDGDLDVKYDKHTPIKTFKQQALNHIPFNYKITIKSETKTDGVMRIFLKPLGKNGNRDIIEMDRFYIKLKKGKNIVRRAEKSAPHLSKSMLTLGELQDKLMKGLISKNQYNWEGCGWPLSLNIPRGKAHGMMWELVAMVSTILEDKEGREREKWNSGKNVSWSFCGIYHGSIPDKRPMGFPFDRDFPSLHRLMQNKSTGMKKTNWSIIHVNIKHLG